MIEHLPSSEIDHSKFEWHLGDIKIFDLTPDVETVKSDLDSEFGKYSPDEARDDRGRWTSGGGGGAAGTIRQVKGRVYSGLPVATRQQPSKLEVGALGERIVMDLLRSQGKNDVRTLNVNVNNFPVDLVQDHAAIEVKAGLVSNGLTAQHWRATIGQPGKEESKWLAKASKELKSAWNEKKGQLILKRKEKAVAALSKKLGKPVKAKTYALIINPDTRKADVYSIPGFHLRVPWNSDLAKKSYVGTVKYGVSKVLDDLELEFGKFNPNHVPAGSSEGGEFASGGGGGSGSVPKTEDLAQRVFQTKLRAMEPLTLYHESPGDVSASMRKNGIGNDDEGVFATIGKPSNFIDAPVKTIVAFKAPVVHVSPDMRYGTDKLEPYQDLLLQHPNLIGADVYVRRAVTASRITSIKVVNK